MTPSPDCPLCPRLCTFREQNRKDYSHFFNAPVPSFGDIDAEFLVVGLAPGLQGANATGRPFTGDYAGIILYKSLLKMGFASGDYLASLPPPWRGRVGEGGNFGWLDEDKVTPPSNSLPQGEGEFTLRNCRITNAVRCVPPENKPETDEIKQCNAFLKAEIAAMPNLKVILSLGLVSHNAVLKALGLKAGFAKFTHGAVYSLIPPPLGGRLGGGLGGTPSSQCPHPGPPPNGEGVKLVDSYHCSRYNINTGRLTQVMFDDVVKQVKALL